MAGFYLGHRETHDLDLFTLTDDIERGFHLIHETAAELGARVEPIQTSPDFRRFLVTRNEEAVVVDLIREYVFQISDEKPLLDGIRVDTPEEIMANKLCTLLSRSEIRDLIDIFELENAGFSLNDALLAASKKDSGLTPAQLAWVLSQIRLGDDAEMPTKISVRKLRNYLQNLIDRLRRLALPAGRD